MKEFKLCGCGNRIPSDWSSCASCQEWRERDAFEGDFERRMERAQLVRVRRSMDYELVQFLTPDEQQSLLDGIARLQQQKALLDLRNKVHAFQHIEVLWKNAMAHRLDVIELAESEHHFE